MGRSRAFRFLILLIVMEMVCGPLAGLSAPVRADTVQEKTVSRAISVVYDDSNSMLMGHNLWWCYAKYSLEVFSSMMQEEDRMNVYYMSDFYDNANRDDNPLWKAALTGLSGASGKRQQTISEIHGKVTRTGATPFNSIETAYDDLKKMTGYDEKWLLVITDGDTFSDSAGNADPTKTSASLDTLFSDCSRSNIRIVYLPISSDETKALAPKEDRSKGIYVYGATIDKQNGSQGILNKMTEICQRVFNRHGMDYEGGSKLKLDLPVSEIIVFAQGARVSIGNLKDADKTETTVSIGASEKNLATLNKVYYDPGDNVDDIGIVPLNAKVAVFTPQKGEFFREGTYDLSVSADEVAVYYKPCLDVHLELADGKGNTVRDKYIDLGTYMLRYWLTYPEGHPLHGERLDQKLFDESYSLTLKAGGKTEQLPAGQEKVDLKTEGDVAVSVVAEYLDYSSSEKTEHFVAEDFTVRDLEVKLDPQYARYRLSTLETDKQEIRVLVSRGGKPIPREEWSQFKVEVGGERSGFRTERNEDSTFTLHPRYADGGKAATAVGDIDYTVTVSAANDHRQTDSGTARGKLNIYDDSSGIEVSLDYKQREYRLSTLDTENDGIQVLVTRDGKPIPADEWDRFRLTCTADGVDFETVNGMDSSFMLYPRYKNKDKLQTKGGEISFRADVSADGDPTGADSGGADGSISIYDDVHATTLGVRIDPQTKELSNVNFIPQDADRAFTVDWNGNPLTREQYENLHVEASMAGEAPLSASAEKDPYVEGKPVTGVVHFELVPDDNGELPEPEELACITDKQWPFTVHAEIDYEGEYSEGKSDPARLTIKEKRSVWDILRKVLPILLPILGALAVILLYTPPIKHYLPIRGSEYMRGGRRTLRETVNWWAGANWATVLIPKIPMKSRAEVIDNTGHHSVSIMAEACGGTRAKVTVIDEKGDRHVYRIDGGRVEANGEPTSTSLKSLRIEKDGKLIARFTEE